MFRKKYLIILLAIINLPLNAQNQAVSNFVNAPCLKRANISLMVKEAASGKIVMQHRAEKLTTPASTIKLVTTATALELLGADFRFETKLQYDGTIRNGTLDGNLYIAGGGDPTLGSQFMGDSAFLAKWTAEVRKLGIRKITGAVVGDATLFSTEGIPPKWTWEDMGNYYGAGAYGISIYDNSYKLSFRSAAAGTTPEIVKLSPEMPDLRFFNFLKAANNSKDSAYIYGAPFVNDRYIYGTIPANQKEFTIEGDIPNPALFAAQMFEKQLKNSGIEIAQAATAEVPILKLRHTFYLQQSPPLQEIITNINHRSNNHYAEHLFRYLSLQKAQVASIGAAVQTVKDCWRRRGLDVSGLVMYDGCGLSPSDAVSADFFADLLVYEKNKSKQSDVFLSSLPLAGKTGTIRKVLKNTVLEGRVQAKSGSISGVQCYAGYLNWAGKTYVFAVLVSNFSGARSEVVSQIEKLLLSVTK